MKRGSKSFIHLSRPIGLYLHSTSRRMRWSRCRTELDVTTMSTDYGASLITRVSDVLFILYSYYRHGCDPIWHHEPCSNMVWENGSLPGGKKPLSPLISRSSMRSKKHASVLYTDVTSAFCLLSYIINKSIVFPIACSGWQTLMHQNASLRHAQLRKISTFVIEK